MTGWVTASWATASRPEPGVGLHMQERDVWTFDAGAIHFSCLGPAGQAQNSEGPLKVGRVGEAQTGHEETVVTCSSKVYSAADSGHP